MSIFDVDTAAAEPAELQSLTQAYLIEAGVLFVARAIDLLNVEQTFRLTAIVAGVTFSGEPNPAVTAVLRSIGHDYEEASASLLASQSVTGAALLRNSVLGLWQAFELYLSDSLTVLFYSFPRFLTTPPENVVLPPVNFDDVFTATSLLHARRSIARRKVVQLVQADNVFDLLRHSEKRFGVTLGALGDSDRRSLLELAARRNLWIHNAGIVNDIYLRLVRRHGIPCTLTEGTSAPLDSAYLASARDLTRRAALAVSTALADAVPQIYRYHTSLAGN